MVVFITSLKNPLNTNSYELVSKLLATTLKSVCNQTSTEFYVIIVCNKIPPAAFYHPKVQYIEVDFPPPSPLKSPYIEADALRLDRGCKYTIGLLHARKFNPTHIMFLDCDDFISNRIADFVRQDPDGNGWFIQDGYRYNAVSKKCYLMNGNFQQICGTSHIVKISLYDISADLPLDASQERILKSLGREYLYKIMGSHRFIVNRLRQKGTPLSPLPFRGAIYHINHGDNHSRRDNKLLGVNLTEETCKEFNLTNIQQHPLHHLWGYQIKSRIQAAMDKLTNRLL